MNIRALFAKEVPEDAIDAIDYEQQGCTLFDLGKGAQIDYVENYAAKKWFSKGFTINVQVGDNAYGHTESTCGRRTLTVKATSFTRVRGQDLSRSLSS